MINQQEARRRIQLEWSNWDGKTGSKSDSDKRAFYEWLKVNRPQTLQFPLDGDKWRAASLWLRGR